MPGRYRLRAAHVLASAGTAVVLGLAVVSVLAAGFAGYTHAQESATTYTVSERAHVQTVELTARDSAVVAVNDSLWPAGTRLRDRPVYVVESMPRLTVTARAAVPPDTEVAVRQRIVLVVDASVNGNHLWTDQWTMADRNATVTDGVAATSTNISIPALEDRLRRIQSRVAAPVTVSPRIRVVTRYDTGRYNGTLTTAAGLTVRTATYTVGSFKPATRTHADRVTRRVTRYSDPLRRGTVVAGGLAAFAAVGAVTAAIARPRVGDPGELAHRLRRAKFDEWISAGNVPEDAGETTVEVDSLTGLVDVAIDSDRRVIHDEFRGVYVVIDGDTVYEYDDPWTTGFE